MSRNALIVMAVAAAAVALTTGCSSKNSTDGAAGFGSAATTLPGRTAPTDAPGTDNGPVAASIRAHNVTYTPSKVTVTAGQSVQWNFDDGDVPHNVNFDTFRSGDPVTSGTYTHTFTTPGAYNFHCDVHPNMQGTVTVKPAG